MSHVTSKMAAGSCGRLVFAGSFFLLICLVVCDRKLTTIYNPGCDIEQCKQGYQGDSLNIAYVKAAGENDTLHYLISSIGMPSVLVLKTEPNDKHKFSIDWQKLAEKKNIGGAITFPGNVHYSYGVVFTKLYEYNDTDDKALMRFNHSVGFKHNFQDFVWDSLYEADVASKNIVVLNTSTSVGQNTTFTANGSLSFNFTMYSHTGRNLDKFPQLLFNDNITQLDLVISNLTPSYIQSRLGLEVVLLSSDGPKHRPEKFNETNSIDDEYTPGVFKIVSWLTNTLPGDLAGFVQWKPVCYMDEERTRGKATFVRAYDIDTDKNHTEMATEELKDTIMYAYYNTDLSGDKLGVMVSNISFGLSKDGFYTGTNYTVWTCSIGYGTPPLDKISLLVIGIISAGLGLPVIIIMFGGIFVCIKKRKEKNRTGSADSQNKRVN